MTRPTRTGFAFAALLAVAPAAAVGGGMLIAPLQGLAGLAGMRNAAHTLRAAWPVLLFAAWAAVSIFWSPVQRPEQALKIVAAIATGVLLIGAAFHAGATDRRLVRAAAIAAVAVLVAYSAVEAGFDMPLNRLDHEPGVDPGILERNPGKGVSILVALVWSALGALLAAPGRWRAPAAGALALAVGALSLQFHMATNAAGVLAGAAGFALGWLWPRRAALIAGAGVAAWLVTAPLLSPLLLRLPFADALPLSWRMRGRIWDFAIGRIGEKPLFGWGLDGARAFGDRIETIDSLPFRAIPLHPHSFSLHVWLETGLVGALLLAGAIAWCGRLAAQALGAHRAASAALTGAIATLAAIWNVSYGAWQEWWMASAFVALACAVAVRR